MKKAVVALVLSVALWIAHRAREYAYRRAGH